jgi:hypothetical protein
VVERCDEMVDLSYGCCFGCFSDFDMFFSDGRDLTKMDYRLSI